MKSKINVLLIACLVIALLFRICRLPSLPLFGDELDVGYQAYSLLHTLKDYKGNFLPVYIDSLSESRAPLFIYSVTPFVALFGLNEWGVRLASVFFGLISIYLLYLLVSRLSKNRPLGLAAAFVLSLTPWHIHYSRHAFEVTLLLSLILAGTYFCYRFLKTPAPRFALLSLLAFGFSFYTYNTANIFIPLLALFFFTFHSSALKKSLTYKTSLLYGLTAIILITPLLSQILTGAASNRFQLISIFNDPQTVDHLVFKRTGFSSSDSSSQERLFHNKALAYADSFISNYLGSYSPEFLFTQGDPNPRHGLTSHGLLLFSFLPFLLYGLYSQKNTPASPLFLFWLLIAPIPSALTINGGHHATRTFLMTPPLAFFTALGLVNSAKLILPRLKPILLISALLMTVTCLGLYFHEYFTHFPKESFESWNYGQKQTYSNLPNQPAPHTYISNSRYNSLLPYLFYRTYPPQLVNSQSGLDLSHTNLLPGYNGFSLDGQTYFIDNFSDTPFPENISRLAVSGDIFILLQGPDIPGDWNLTKSPIPGFKTLNTVFNPNQTIYSQTLQKL